MSGLEEMEGIMFDKLTTEQKEAFKRRTRAVDALLKSAVEQQPAPRKMPAVHLPHIPSLHAIHLERRAA